MQVRQLHVEGEPVEARSFDDPGLNNQHHLYSVGWTRPDGKYIRLVIPFAGNPDTEHGGVNEVALLRILIDRLAASEAAEENILALTQLRTALTVLKERAANRAAEEAVP